MKLTVRSMAPLAAWSRAIFVLSTVGVAVAGSAAADDVSNVSAWALVAAFAAWLFASDSLKAVEERAVMLDLDSPGKSMKKVRSDVFESARPVGAVVVIGLGLAVKIAVAAAHVLR